MTNGHVLLSVSINLFRLLDLQRRKCSSLKQLIPQMKNRVFFFRSKFINILRFFPSTTLQCYIIISFSSSLYPLSAFLWPSLSLIWKNLFPYFKAPFRALFEIPSWTSVTALSLIGVPAYPWIFVWIFSCSHWYHIILYLFEGAVSHQTASIYPPEVWMVSSAWILMFLPRTNECLLTEFHVIHQIAYQLANSDDLPLKIQRNYFCSFRKLFWAIPPE